MNMFIRSKTGFIDQNVSENVTSFIDEHVVDLLAKSIAEALRLCHDLVVSILQGYTDAHAGQNLFKALAHDFDGRVLFLPAKPRTKLLDVAAFIDQSDIFVSSDTGLMHLAATTKMLGVVSPCQPHLRSFVTACRSQV